MKKIILNDLGFPVEIVNAPEILIDGQIALNINYNTLMHEAFKRLLLKPSCLLGAELRFIRQHLDLNQSEFCSKYLLFLAKDLIVCEKNDLNPSGLLISEEVSLRQTLLLECELFSSSFLKKEAKNILSYAKNHQQNLLTFIYDEDERLELFTFWAPLSEALSSSSLSMIKDQIVLRKRLMKKNAIANEILTKEIKKLQGRYLFIKA